MIEANWWFVGAAFSFGWGFGMQWVTFMRFLERKLSKGGK